MWEIHHNRTSHFFVRALSCSFDSCSQSKSASRPLSADRCMCMLAAAPNTRRPLAGKTVLYTMPHTSLACMQCAISRASCSPHCSACCPALASRRVKGIGCSDFHLTRDPPLLCHHQAITYRPRSEELMVGQPYRRDHLIVQASVGAVLA